MQTQIQKSIKPNRIKTSCENCGKKFYVIPSRKDTAKFCSPKCYSKYQSINRRGKNNPNYGKLKRVKVICKNCNKEFEVQSSLKNRTKYCSKKCQNMKRSPIPLKIICNYCGRNFLQYKDRKDKRRYCSPKCYRNAIKDFEKAFGKEKALEIKKKMSISSINKWKDPIYREKTIKAQLEGLMKRPTKYEKRIAELCIENSLPFIYTGNGTFLINFKNPDFVNFQSKIVIEVFSNYFKIRDYGSIENYKEFCRKKYEPLGWKVIFIGEEDIDEHYQKRDNWKNICLNKILEVK